MQKDQYLVFHRTEGLVANFAEKTKGMDGAARGACLERDVGICEAHSSSAQEGQTQVAITSSFSVLTLCP